jgi:hypothetical protein
LGVLGSKNLELLKTIATLIPNLVRPLAATTYLNWGFFRIKLKKY